MTYVPRGVLAAFLLAMCLSRASGQYPLEMAAPPLDPTTAAPNDLMVVDESITAVLPDLNPYSALSSAPSEPPYSELVPTPEAQAPTEASNSDTTELPPGDGAVVHADEADASYTWYDPLDWFDSSPWGVEIELGLNGATGTSEALSITGGGHVKRKTPTTKFVADATYNKSTAGGTQTQNNAKLDLRNDWQLTDKSRWSVFAMSTLFYDEFQAFDLQINANSGIGYRCVDKDWLQLTNRVGSGASREFDGPVDRWIPEANFGVDYEQHITPHQKLTGRVDYFPEWEQFEEFRLVTEVGWEIELIQPSNMSLKISATDRYDSTPNGADPQILNYSVLMIWKL